MNPWPNPVDAAMTTKTIARADIRRPLMWGAMLAVLWVAVAIVQPTSTFHLAPFLIAAAPPVLFTLDEGTDTDRDSLLRVGVMSLALAIGAALVLLAIGVMDGPVFEMFPSPVVEAFVFAAIGAVSGVVVGWWRTR